MKKSIAAILFLFFIPLLVFSGTGIDAKYLEKEITFTLNPDGGWQKEYRHRIKLETFLAVSRLCGETFIKYNPRYQELKVLKSETTMKDGKKVPSTPNAFNEVLPRDAHNFAHYSHLREMVVTHLGLEREAVIEMHYRLKTKPGFMPYLSAREYIADRFPTDRLVLKIWVPDGRKFNYQLFHVDGKPETKRRGDHTLYTFTFNNVKSFIEEPLNKTYSKSFLVFSTAKGWESVFPSPEDVGPLPKSLIKKIDELKASSA
ncbi:MAG: DUF3857 domain-containing protein, partial [bacterium]|nr:DUF3857 domain-containing protein [bacterium]